MPSAGPVVSQPLPSSTSSFVRGPLPPCFSAAEGCRDFILPVRGWFFGQNASVCFVVELMRGDGGEEGWQNGRQRGSNIGCVLLAFVHPIYFVYHTLYAPVGHSERL